MLMHIFYEYGIIGRLKDVVSADGKHISVNYIVS